MFTHSLVVVVTWALFPIASVYFRFGYEKITSRDATFWHEHPIVINHKTQRPQWTPVQKEYLKYRQAYRCFDCYWLLHWCARDIDHTPALWFLLRFSDLAALSNPNNFRFLCKECHAIKTEGDRVQWTRAARQDRQANY